MKHLVVQTVQNAQIGVPQSEDGIGLIFFDCPTNTVVTGTGFNLDTPYLITSLADLVALGLTAAFDTTNGTRIYQDVSDFYNEAAIGTLLWVVLTNVAGDFSDYIATVNGAHDNCIIQTGVADFTQKTKIVGYAYKVPTTANTGSNDFPTDVSLTITAAKTKQATMSGLGYSYYYIVDGYNMNISRTAATLGSLFTYAAPYGSLCITGVHPNGVSAIGAYLAKLSKISIGTSPGFVNDGLGLINFNDAFFTNGLYVAPGTGTLTVGRICTVFGNSITVAETKSSVTFTPNVALSGTGRNAQVYAIINGQAVNLGYISVADGASAATVATNMVSAINAQTVNTGFTATSATSNLTVTAPAGAGGIYNGLQIFYRISNAANVYVDYPYNLAGGTDAKSSTTQSDWAVTYNGVTYTYGQSFTVVTGFTTYTSVLGGFAVQSVTSVKSLSPSNATGTGDIDLLGAKQYLFIRTFAGSNVSGLYWNDGATCEDSSYTIVEAPQVRIANHYLDAARSFIIRKSINAQVITDAAGNVSPVWASPLQAQFSKLYFDPLANGTGTGDINSGTIVITGVNFKTTRQLSYTITINQNDTCWSVQSSITLN